MSSRPAPRTELSGPREPSAPAEASRVADIIARPVGTVVVISNPPNGDEIRLERLTARTLHLHSDSRDRKLSFERALDLTDAYDRDWLDAMLFRRGRPGSKVNLHVGPLHRREAPAPHPAVDEVSED